MRYFDLPRVPAEPISEQDARFVSAWAESFNDRPVAASALLSVARSTRVYADSLSLRGDRAAMISMARRHLARILDRSVAGFVVRSQRSGNNVRYRLELGGILG